MNKTISLTIRMNKPCNEDWNSMQLIDGARFCDQCQKPVRDFIDFSEEQILDYFLKNPGPVCGRIINYQKNCHFEQFDSKPLRNIKFAPVAATLLALTNLTASAEIKFDISNKLLQTQPIKKGSLPQPFSDSIIISGIIKGFNGTPIENAEISFNEIKKFSDKSGFFEFLIPPELNKPTIIQFSSGNLITQVRNYNPAMGSTNFDVILYERRGSVSMGVMLPEYYLPDSLTTLSINLTEKLDAKTKTFLKEVSTALKANPRLNITLMPYYKTNYNKANKFSIIVKNFLVIEMGITHERILINKPALQKQNKSELMLEFISNIE